MIRGIHALFSPIKWLGSGMFFIRTLDFRIKEGAGNGGYLHRGKIHPGFILPVIVGIVPG